MNTYVKKIAMMVLMGLVFCGHLMACYTPPVADVDETEIYVCPGDSFNLDGSGSFDPDDPNGINLSYTWSCSDPNFVIDNQADPNVTCHFTNSGTYTVQLEVSKPGTESDTDTCIVHVVNVWQLEPDEGSEKFGSMHMPTGEFYVISGSGDVTVTAVPWPSVSTLPANWTLEIISQPAGGTAAVRADERHVDDISKAILGTTVITCTSGTSTETIEVIVCVDSDTDGIPDALETHYWGDPNTANHTTDGDGDGLLDYQEYLYGTCPMYTDTDEDGLPDWWELKFNMGSMCPLDPTLADSDGDGVEDGDEDYDGDGLNNAAEYAGYEEGENPYCPGYPYLTSFEEKQNFAIDDSTPNPTPIHGIDGWAANPTDSAILVAEDFDPVEKSLFSHTGPWRVESRSVITQIMRETYDPDYENEETYAYQYVDIDPNGTVFRTFKGISAENRVFRINCIPNAGSKISLTNTGDSDTFAYVEFNSSDNNIHIKDGTDQNTGINYSTIASQCITNLGGTDHNGYENAWIDILIIVDWAAQTYDVSWKHYGTSGNYVLLYPDAAFSTRYEDGSLRIYSGGSATRDFKLNRVSVSSETNSGGVFGPDGDIWISQPVVDIDNPLIGQNTVVGSVWYDKLGHYEILACPNYQDPEDPNNWTLADSGGSVCKAAILGYWDASQFFNGDYYLKLAIYDDIGKLQTASSGIITRDLHFNGTTKTIQAQYPVIGRAKAKGFHYEFLADVTIPWQGSFPFEFKRIYDDGLLGMFQPLCFGWTHNHNIRLTEDCKADWEQDEDHFIIGDGNGLGVGRLWLQQGLGCRLYEGYVLATGEVKYIPFDLRDLPLDYHRDYIIRVSTVVDSTHVRLTYTHYGPDGKTMIFEHIESNNLALSYALPANPSTSEGVVDWNVSLGIHSQADRFGNALVYDWQIVEGDYYYLKKITTVPYNLSHSVSLVFTNEVPAVFGGTGPENMKLITAISVQAGTETWDVMKFETKYEYEIFSYSWTMPGIDTSGYEGYTNLPAEDFLLYTGKCWYSDVAKKDMRLGYFQPYSKCIPHGENYYDGGWSPVYLFEYNEDSTLYVIGKTTAKETDLIQYVNPACALAERYYDVYTYSYDKFGNQKTIREYATDFKVYGAGSINDPIYDKDSATLIRTETTVTSPDGALLSQTTQTHANNLTNPGAATTSFDPNNYSLMEYNSTTPGPVVTDYRFYAGGGSVTNNKFSYGNALYPLQPTEIQEYLDADGNPTNGIGVAGRKTTLAYDNYGNLEEKRVYVDATNYVLTEYDFFHSQYNFPTSERTWQGLCYGDGAGQVKTGQQVETRWIYGDPNGVEAVDPNDDARYLIHERKLLTSSTWAETSYTYTPEGQVLTVTEPRSDGNPGTTTTTIGYDTNGFKEKVWIGTSTSGDPQQRYYHDSYGREVLAANSLGQVTRNLYWQIDPDNFPEKHSYDPNDYFFAKPTTVIVNGDSTAMSRADFVPSSYNNVDLNTVSHTLYLYNSLGRACLMQLPSGYVVRPKYYMNTDQLLSIDYSDASIDVWHEFCSHYNNKRFWQITPDGTVLAESVQYCDSEITRHLLCTKLNVLDSMDRVAYQYDLKSDIVFINHNFSGPEEFNPYLQRKDITYTASGRKSLETVYKVPVERSEADYDSISYGTPVLEKCTQYIYDELDRLEWQIEDPNIPENPNYGSCDPITTRFGYDMVGNQIYVIDPNGKILLTVYDNANRKIEEYFASDPNYVSGTIVDVAASLSNAELRKEYTYYDTGKVESVTSYDTDGSTVLEHAVFTYDAQGRILSVVKDVTGSQYATTTYTYYDAGTTTSEDPGVTYHLKISNKLSDTQWKNTWIQFHYDGQISRIYYSSGDKEIITYNDLVGKPATKTVWQGVNSYAINYAYNEWGKLETVTYPNSGGTITYEYTSPIFGEYGLVKSITDHRATVDRPGADYSTYDFEYYLGCEILGKFTNQDDYVFEYDYNSAYGRKQSVTVSELIEEDPDVYETIYSAGYDYNLLGRMVGVKDTLDPDPNYHLTLTSLDYDNNGNRSELKYHLTGNGDTPCLYLDYLYTPDNWLRQYTLTGSSGLTVPTFTLRDPNNTADAHIDGLGRLVIAAETLTDPNGTAVSHVSYNSYDRNSQLTYNAISNTPDSWAMAYDYYLDGNLESTLYKGLDTTEYEYTGDRMDSMGESDLLWDLNGNLTAGLGGLSATWNWDNRLRTASKNGDSIACKYAPDGSRLYRQQTVSSTTTARKYLVDINGDFPQVLMELDPNNNDAIEKTYIWANNQLLAQYDGDTPSPIYFYLHDRLGSVRNVLHYDTGTSTVKVDHSYTYNPYGETLIHNAAANAVTNDFRFAGYIWDDVIGQYYCYKRWYDPGLTRFTGSDPVKGNFAIPLSQHPNLYCQNNPINSIDPTGLSNVEVEIYNEQATQNLIQECIAFVETTGFPSGSFQAFSGGGDYDIKARHKLDIFTIGQVKMKSGDFGNYLTAYTNVYLYGFSGEIGTRIGGHAYSQMEWNCWDDLASRYFITAGVLQAVTDRRREGTQNGTFGTLHYVESKLNFNSMSIERLLEVPLESNAFDQRLSEATQFWNSTSWR